MEAYFDINTSSHRDESIFYKKRLKGFSLNSDNKINRTYYSLKCKDNTPSNLGKISLNGKDLKRKYNIKQQHYK